MKDKLGQQPAFPCENGVRGMSKRYWTAVMIAARYTGAISAEAIAKASFEIADALLEQENR